MPAPTLTEPARSVPVHEVDPAALRAKLARNGVFLGDAWAR